MELSGAGGCDRTWSALLEELVEVQRGGSGVGLLGSGWRGGRLLCFLHRIFKRGAGVGPGGEATRAEEQNHLNEVNEQRKSVLNLFFFISHLGLVFVLICGSRS